MAEPGYTILLIEDSISVRKAFASILASKGYTVIEAEDGKVGIKLFDKKHPDLVMTDILMPELDGHQVVRHVANRSPNTPIIVVSGTDRVDDVAKAIQLGTWDYILKPVKDAEVLLHTVKKALEKRELLEENIRYRDHLEQLVGERTGELQNSLAEKEQLLKEVHHRVKNNLQIISSLLNLQIGIEEKSCCIEPMEKMKNRITSMALIHELLYHAQDLAMIPFHEYIPKLTESIQNGSPEVKGAVHLQLHLDELFLPIETAVPCGLILNELVANSFQHAFPTKETEREEKRINIILKKESESVSLQVRDNGIGIPDGAFSSDNSHSLGYLLVSTLTSQIGGNLQAENEKGARIGVVFPHK